MFYGPTYELLTCCLHTLLEFVDGSNQDDTNVLYVTENGYVKVACALLGFRYFLDADLNLSKTKKATNHIVNALSNQVHPKNQKRVSPEDEEIHKEARNAHEDAEDNAVAIPPDQPEDRNPKEKELNVVQHNFKCIYKC
jgi:hypothetical protein